MYANAHKYIVTTLLVLITTDDVVFVYATIIIATHAVYTNLRVPVPRAMRVISTMTLMKLSMRLNPNYSTHNYMDTLLLLTLGAHAHSEGYSSCHVLCVTTHNCRLTHWNHKTKIPTSS